MKRHSSLIFVSIESLRSGKCTLKYADTPRSTSYNLRNSQRSSLKQVVVGHSYKSFSGLPVFDNWYQADAYRSAICREAGVSEVTDLMWPSSFVSRTEWPSIEEALNAE